MSNDNPKSEAGKRGHAFLAEFRLSGNLDAAKAAFNAEERPHVTKPGWLSHSSLASLQECPTRFYLSRILALQPRDLRTDASKAEEVMEAASLCAQTLDACLWLAPTLDEQDRFRALGTEVYLESQEPWRYRGFVDELAYDLQTDCLAVIDNKFTFRDDARVALRMLYGDQMPLYAAIWNQHHEAWGLPPIRELVTRVIVVNAKGKHKLMPAEVRYFSHVQEKAFLLRALWNQEQAGAFACQALDRGFEYAAQFMRPNACMGWKACPYIPVCHHGMAPETNDRFVIESEQEENTDEA
jgi:hypothetical protein